MNTLRKRKAKSLPQLYMEEMNTSAGTEEELVTGAISSAVTASSSATTWLMSMNFYWRKTINENSKVDSPCPQLKQLVHHWSFPQQPLQEHQLQCWQLLSPVLLSITSHSQVILTFYVHALLISLSFQLCHFICLMFALPAQPSSPAQPGSPAACSASPPIGTPG